MAFPTNNFFQEHLVFSQNFSKVLELALNPDSSARVEAEKQISKLAEDNFDLFLLHLSEVIKNEKCKKESRLLAGTIFKIFITNPKYINKWINLNQQLKNQIKQNILSLLACQDNGIRKACSLAIAAMAKVELQNKQSMDIFNLLITEIYNTNDIFIKLSVITALSYTFQEIEKEQLGSDSLSLILCTMVNILSIDNIPIPGELIIACFKALINLIPFLGDIFKVKEKRDYFFLNLFSKYIKSPDKNVRKVTIQIYSEFIKYNYEYLQDYETDIINDTTFLMKNDEEDNVILVYEIWSELCDIEISRFKNSVLQKECIMIAQHASENLFGIIKKHLVTKDYDNDEWNLSKAAGNLLSQLSQCTYQIFIHEVLNYIGFHFLSPDEDLKHAALVAFGVILNTSHHAYLIKIVRETLDIMFKYIEEPTTIGHIKYISAWVIEKIATNFASDLIDEYSNIFNKLIKLLDINDNKLLVPICYSFHYFSKGIGFRNDQTTNPLSPVAKESMNKLLHLACRPTSYDRDHNVALAGLFALGTIAQHCARDMQQALQEIFIQLVQAFEYTSNTQGIPSEEARLNYQLYIANTLGVLILVTSVNDEQLSKVLDFTINTFNSRLEVYEEGLNLIGSIAFAMGSNFEPLMNKCGVYIIEGIKSTNMTYVCYSSIHCLLDIIPSLGEKFMNYCPHFLNPLFEILTNQNIDTKLKPPVFSIISDLFLYCKDSIFPSFNNVMTIIGAALEETSKKVVDDQEIIDYYIDLREHIIETITVIFSTICDSNKENEFIPFVPVIMLFLKKINQPEYFPTYTISKGSLGLIADFCNTFKKDMGVMIDRIVVDNMLGIVTTKSDPSLDQDSHYQFIQFVREKISEVIS